MDHSVPVVDYYLIPIPTQHLKPSSSESSSTPSVGKQQLLQQPAVSWDLCLWRAVSAVLLDAEAWRWLQPMEASHIYHSTGRCGQSRCVYASACQAGETSGYSLQITRFDHKHNHGQDDMSGYLRSIFRYPTRPLTKIVSHMSATVRQNSAISSWGQKKPPSLLDKLQHTPQLSTAATCWLQESGALEKPALERLCLWSASIEHERADLLSLGAPKSSRASGTLVAHTVGITNSGPANHRIQEHPYETV